MTEQTDAAEVLTAAESNELCEALDADGCHGFLHDHVETLAALGRLFAAREAAAEARGAERALREAADEVEADKALLLADLNQKGVAFALQATVTEGHDRAIGILRARAAAAGGAR